MQRKLVRTEDGSHTLHVPELGEHYHSIHGAVTESKHIFIEAAFNFCSLKSIRVLEFGMGTGLNVMLTCCEASRRNVTVYYHAIEKYPVIRTEAEELNLHTACGMKDPAVFKRIHSGRWNRDIRLTENFTLYKEKADFRNSEAEGPFDVIYFDAFAPDIQPKLWTPEMFQKIYDLASPGAVLTTYSAKGKVRRNIASAGFTVTKMPGPPGKREITRAVKQINA